MRTFLEHGLPDLVRRLERNSLDALVRGYTRWEAEHLAGLDQEQNADSHALVVRYLLFAVDDRLERVYALRASRVEFESRYAHATTDSERDLHVLDFARELGAERWQLVGDRLAMRRWFGRDTVLERYQRRLGETEQLLSFVLDRLGVLAPLVLAERSDDDARTELFRQLAADRKLERILTYDGEVRVQNAAFSALAAMLARLPASERESMVKANVLLYIYRSALDHTRDVWLQCEALGLMQHLSQDSFERAVRARLEHPREGDDLFVRRRAIQLAGENVARMPQLKSLFRPSLDDPSAFVRQALAEVIWRLGADDALPLFEHLASADAAGAVRAAALRAILRRAPETSALEPIAAVVCRIFEHERDSYVVRVALQTAADYHLQLVTEDETTLAAQWRHRLRPAIDRLHGAGEPVSVRRWAARARERLWCQADAQRYAACVALGEFVPTIKVGRSRRVPRAITGAIDPDTLARVLAIVSIDDFSLSLSGSRARLRLHRGERFGFRTWRFLHELRHSATDKRQAFPHTIGRIFHGTRRAPSAYLAEQTETRVPGEPLYIEHEDGWRPYLPLVDEAISCIDEHLGAATVRFFTAEGVTRLRAPRTFFGRLRARIALTLKFVVYARLRNWRDSDGTPTAYVAALRALGFELSFEAHGAGSDDGETWPADPAVSQFFPAAFAGIGPGTVTDLKQYFFSVYENTIYELTLFLIAIASITLGRHALVARAVRHARRRLPLVVGGWGTRGKSGTERMKAALFAAMGYGVISKTTGTEAMFLRNTRYGALGEMFLFRPYDKATIWEQVNVLRFAADTRADVFLWECMGLTPSYVSVLQHDWMNDDLATITNTYPDHEDLQGPAGINIPQVMTEFIPARATLITSELHMLPILRDAASRRGTRTDAVGWLDCGLITEDIIARYPYEEHPNNIALVLAMARNLGVDDDFALKETADHVLPDLGVLKAFPPAQVGGCTLEFVNGMAANERLGFLGNWRRIGFASHKLEQDPGTWIATLINNRADRIPRSRVFAEILVQDIGADCHYLIGSNTGGFMAYLEEAWAEYAAEYRLWGGSAGADPVGKFLDDARRLRVPVNPGMVTARLGAMLAGLGASVDPTALEAAYRDPVELEYVLKSAGVGDYMSRITEHVVRLHKEMETCSAFVEELRGADAEQAGMWSQRAADTLWQWLRARVVIIEGVTISGNQIIDRIAASTPPGLRNWLLGAQNIKGPGLDFVYRWQAWETCSKACDDLSGDDPLRAERGLDVLAGFQEFGPLCEQRTAATLEAARESELAQSETFQSRLWLVETNLAKQLEQARTHAEGGSGEVRFPAVVKSIEAFLDAGDAVRRRKRADRIYRDLINERISSARATLELQKLNKRQKGGWLSARLSRKPAGTA